VAKSRKRLKKIGLQIRMKKGVIVMKTILLSLLTLLFLSIPLCAQDAGAKPATADPKAYELLKSAQSARETFPADFAGFKAELICNDNGQVATGTIDYQPATGAKLAISGLSDEAHGWLTQQINSLLMHRRSRDFNEGDGRHPLSLAPDDQSPLGHRVLLNDKLKSSYRIRDGQTTEVDRTMGDHRIVISILATTATGKGKYLPHHFAVNTFDVKSGALKRTDMFTDEFVQVDGVWLPASRRVITGEDGKVTARVITIRNPQLHRVRDAASK
jgi:hypothetical protein